MKKLIALLTVVATVSAYSQGTLEFNNYFDPGVDAPIGYSAGGPVAGGTLVGGATVNSGGFTWGGQYALAMLYAGPAGTAESALVPITPPVAFDTVFPGYLAPGSASTRTLNIPGATVAGGGNATVQIRVWDTGSAGINSYEDALALGRPVYVAKSAVLTVVTGGDTSGGTPTLPKPLAGLTSFDMTYVPEPSIVGLGILGAIGGLFLFRRRS